MKWVSNLYQHTEKQIKQWVFSSSKNSRFQNEAKWKTFLVKMSFICMRIEYHFHVSSFTLSLALKQRLGAARKWPIYKSGWHVPTQRNAPASSSGASFFAWQRWARNEWLVMNSKGPWEGYRRQAPVVSFPPSFARTFSERRLGTRQGTRS